MAPAGTALAAPDPRIVAAAQRRGVVTAATYDGTADDAALTFLDELLKLRCARMGS